MELNLKTFFTSQQCKLAIDLLTEQNAPVKQELLDRYNELLEKEKVNEPNTGGELLAIYPHFCAQNKYSEDLKKCIEGTVDNLFALNLDAEEARKPGLLLGKIQSGKTRAFVGCMALAFDRGVDACIILTKGTNALVEQTIQRMNWDFRDCKRNAKNKRFPTVSIYDIMLKRNGLKSSLIRREKNIFVAKKEDDNLRSLISVFHNSEFKEKRILIIDDEADFVSHSFKVNKGDKYKGTIAGLIDELVEGLPNSRYLQVTATPYSLYLQPDNYVEVVNGKVMPFRPRFTTVLESYPEYIGYQQYFVESANDQSMYSYLHHKLSAKCVISLTKGKKYNGHSINRNILMNKAADSIYIKDFRWAIMHYFVASAIREIQEERIYNTSFIIHISNNKADHAWEANLLNEILNRWSDMIDTGDFQNDFNALFDEIYDDISHSMLLASNEFNVDGRHIIPEVPNKYDVQDRVFYLIKEDEYNVQIVNSDERIGSLLDEDGQLELSHMLNIFIGGNVLDRGITISNMLGFIYGREPKIKQQASMLQHCRMYGNRSLADMAVTRFFATQTLYDAMKRVNELDNMMRERFTEALNDPTKNPQIEFVYHDKSNGIIPIPPNNLAISNVIWWKKSSFVIPSGQQIISNVTQLEALIDRINVIFEGHKDRECFEVDAEIAKVLVLWAKDQFEYSAKLGNKTYEWDGADMLSLIDRFKKDNKIKLYRRLYCETGRTRKDRRGFIDAPVDGQKESPYVKREAYDVPVLMMQHELGLKEKGWLGHEFYWPVLCLPNQMDNIAYCPRNNSCAVFENPLSEAEFAVNGMN